MILTKNERDKIKRLILEGKVFVYPTDTVYGMGCDAKNEKSVKRIRDIKKRRDKPFSVIAPSKDWIIRNCKVKMKDLDILPGPYTIIAKLKKDAVCSDVNLGMDTIGLRIPKHWFSGLIGELGIPVVTTSVNVSGKKYMTSIDNIDIKIKEKVDFLVYEGKLDGRPSNIVNLVTGEEKNR